MLPARTYRSVRAGIQLSYAANKLFSFRGAKIKDNFRLLAAFRDVQTREF